MFSFFKTKKPEEPRPRFKITVDGYGKYRVFEMVPGLGTYQMQKDKTLQNMAQAEKVIEEYLEWEIKRNQTTVKLIY